MTTLQTAAQQALDALEGGADSWQLVGPAIDALKAALAEPVQEPVAWLFTNLQSGDYDFCYCEDEHAHDREMWHKLPLYTAPPQRLPLTEEEIKKLLIEHAGMTVVFSEVDLRFARAIERAHGIGGQP